MLHARLSFLLPALLAGCVSVSSNKSTEAPDYMAFCLDKETQCKQICADTGVQGFSCKIASHEVMEYKCECRKPLGGKI